MTDRPNVVVLTTDQQRADACAREGFALDTTPFLDDLARRGTWFDRAYTSTPVCAPARTSLLTGRFPTATGVWANEGADEARFDRDLFDVMDDAGYETAMVGKNHTYLDPERADHWVEFGHTGAVSENAREARTVEDERFEAYLEDLWLFEGGAGWDDEPTPTPVETQCAARCVSHATEWIASLDHDPFFLWLSFPEPHNPFQVPEPYFSMFPPEDLPPASPGPETLDRKPFPWRWLRQIGVARARRAAPDADYDGEILPEIRSRYYGMLRMVDDQVRRFVEFLESAGRRDDTLLVVHADHGDFAGDYGLTRKGVGLTDAIARIPLILDGPGVESSDSPSDAHVSIVDLLPTLCDVADAEVPAGVQGRSLWPVLSGEEGAAADFGSVYAEAGIGGGLSGPDDVPPIEEATKDELNPHTTSGRRAMVRREEWKLVVDAEGGTELYDLEGDPAEETDLSDVPAHRDELIDMYGEFGSWSLAVRDTLPGGTSRPFDPGSRRD